MARKSTPRWLASWKRAIIDIFTSSSIKYTAIEMNERSIGPAEFHALEVQPRKMSMQDAAGGTDIGGAGVETTNAKPIALMEKLDPGADSSSLVSFEGDEPTEEERRTLRKVADKLPWSAFLVAMVELCERFTYYGLSGPFQNYIQNSYNDPKGLPGAIGMSFLRTSDSHMTKLMVVRSWRDWCHWFDRLLSVLVLCHANLRRHCIRSVSW